MNKNFQQAFQNKTRSADGKPGADYWQNFGKYVMDVTVAPPSRIISGSETIYYYNGSPDTLHEIYFRLVQNAHRKNAHRDSKVTSGYFTDGMNIISLMVDKKEKTSALKIAPGSNGTREFIHLDKPLPPKTSVEISVKWNYELSEDSRSDQPRDGVIDSTTFFLAYWYPRVDVYDDVNHWDQTDFTELQEFYNDFNDYDFTIHAPAGFVVWSTGELKNENEVLSGMLSGKLNTAQRFDSTIHLITEKDFASMKQLVPSGAWKYSAKNVTDVAFGISNHFLWDAGGVNIPGSRWGRVSVQSAYAVDSKDFQKEVDLGKKCLRFFSDSLPGVIYPYSKMILFNGNSFMEYPMMVNDMSDPDYDDWVATTAHEIAHTYFPFFMGINESRYGWMDEGWAAFNELNYSRYELDSIADWVFTNFYVPHNLKKARKKLTSPLMTESTQLKGLPYEFNSYGKPALAYEALRSLLGDTLFKKCLNQYMLRWNGKHPVPYDFFNTFNDVSGKNLNWFWRAWFFEPNYFDLEVKNISVNGNSASITISNTGGLPVPFKIQVLVESGIETFYFSANEWESKKEITVQVKTKSKIQSVRLLHGVFIDWNPKNG